MNTIDNLVSYYGVFDGINNWKRPLNYWVTVCNIGKEPIVMREPIHIYKASDSDDGTFSGGNMCYGGGGSIGPFFYKPYPEIAVKWYTVEPEDYKKGLKNPDWSDFDMNKVLKRKSVGCTVPVKLPEEFTKSKGNEIIFFIDSDYNKVYVSYVIEVNEDKYKEIDSDGNLFNIEKAIGRKLPKTAEGHYPYTPYNEWHLWGNR